MKISLCILLLVSAFARHSHEVFTTPGWNGLGGSTISTTSFNNGWYNPTNLVNTQTSLVNPWGLSASSWGTTSTWNRYPSGYVNPSASVLRSYWNRYPGGVRQWRRGSLAGTVCNSFGQPIRYGPNQNFYGPTRISCVVGNQYTYSQICMNYQQCAWVFCRLQQCFRTGGRIREEAAF